MDAAGGIGRSVRWGGSGQVQVGLRVFDTGRKGYREEGPAVKR